MAAMRANDAQVLTHRGVRDRNRGYTSRNEAAFVLGEAVGAVVMGPEDWALYCTTSVKKMKPLDKPLPAPENVKRAKERPSGERNGWVLHRAAVSKLRG